MRGCRDRRARRRRAAPRGATPSLRQALQTYRRRPREASSAVLRITALVKHTQDRHEARERLFDPLSQKITKLTPSLAPRANGRHRDPPVEREESDRYCNLSV